MLALQKNPVLLGRLPKKSEAYYLRIGKPEPDHVGSRLVYGRLGFCSVDLSYRK